MKSSELLVVLLVGLVAIVSTGCASGQAAAYDGTAKAVVVSGGVHAKVVVVHKRPPLARVDVRHHRPTRRHVWVPGHWKWTGRKYVWVKGRWAVPPRGRRAYVAGRWVNHHSGGWVFVRGYWR